MSYILHTNRTLEALGKEIEPRFHWNKIVFTHASVW